MAKSLQVKQAEALVRKIAYEKLSIDEKIQRAKIRGASTRELSRLEKLKERNK